MENFDDKEECEEDNNDSHIESDDDEIKLAASNDQIVKLKNAIRDDVTYEKSKWEIYLENCFKYNVPPVHLVNGVLEIKNGILDLSVNSSSLLTNFKLEFNFNNFLYLHSSITFLEVLAFN